MSNVNVTDHSVAAVVILNAMSEACPRDEMLSHFRVVSTHKDDHTCGVLGPNVELKITVNGVEVDAVASLVECWKRLEQDRDKDIRKMALKLINEIHLDKLYDAVKNAEWMVKQAISERFPDAVFDDED